MATEHTDQEFPNNQRQYQTGDLAESARRHIAYERLARQIAASENAARLVLAALGRIGHDIKLEEDADEHNHGG